MISRVYILILTNFFTGDVYTSDKNGNDETGDGTSEKPFKTALQALRIKAQGDNFPTIYVDSKEEEKVSN